MTHIKYLLYIPLVASIITMMLFIWDIQTIINDELEVKVFKTLLLFLIVGLTREVSKLVK